MTEVIARGERLRTVITVIIRFASSNLNIYTIQDVMHDVQLATYWLNKAVAGFYDDESRGILQSSDSTEEETSEELPTEPEAQIQFLLKELIEFQDTIKGTLNDVPLDGDTEFNLESALFRLTEAEYNTRMTKIAYEGLQNFRRTN